MERSGRWAVVPNRPESIRKLVKKLGPVGALRVCYEAGPTGYVIYWQLTALGVRCEVVAPTLVPTKAGDRVKTDRRDAEKLARSYRAGDLTAVWVPDAAHEALRDLVRAREAAKKDQLRARHRLGKFLLRHGRRPSTAMTAWTQRHLTWIRQVRFEQPAQEATRLDYLHEVEHVVGRIARLERAIDEAVKTAPPRMRAVIEALQALRGIALVSAVTIVAEVGDLSRFAASAAADGLQRDGRARGLQWPADAAGWDYEDRERASAAHRHRGGVGLSASAGRRRRPPETPSHRQRGGESDRLEGSAPVARPLSQTAGPRQMPAAGRHGGGPRALGLHLGDWRDRRARPAEDVVTDRGVAREEETRETRKAATMAAEGHTERRTLERSMR